MVQDLRAEACAQRASPLSLSLKRRVRDDPTNIPRFTHRILVDRQHDFSGSETGHDISCPYKYKGRHTGLPLQKTTEFHLASY
jgi:hypothetical protein